MNPAASKSARAASLDVVESVRTVLDGVRATGRTMLTAPEAKIVCDAYGIPLPKEGLAVSADQAVRLARSIGYPVVMKVVSTDIVHKSKAGGVVVGVKTDGEARAAFDRILANVGRHTSGAGLIGVQIQQMLPHGATQTRIGAVTDPSFGKLVVVGLGGGGGETLKMIHHLAPVSHEQALGMISSVRMQEALNGARGSAAVNRDALADILVNVSAMLADFPELHELDLDGVFATEHFATAVDARIVCGATPREERSRTGEKPPLTSADLKLRSAAVIADGRSGAALSSRSGEVCAAIAAYARATGMRVSSIVDLDRASEIDEADLLSVLEQDPDASVIAMHFQDLEDGRAFAETASRVTQTKPVIMLKVGRTPYGAKAAAGVAGVPSVNDRIYDDVLRASGVIRAPSLRWMLDCARGLQILPDPKGENVLIVADGAGAAVLLADACFDNGLTLIPTPEALKASVDKLAARSDHVGGQCDVIGDGLAGPYLDAVRLALESERVDAIVLGCWGMASASPLAFADGLIELVTVMRARGIDKPVVVSLAGEAELEAACARLCGHGVLAGPNMTDVPVEALGAKYEWARRAGRLAA